MVFCECKLKADSERLALSLDQPPSIPPQPTLFLGLGSRPIQHMCTPRPRPCARARLLMKLAKVAEPVTAPGGAGLCRTVCTENRSAVESLGSGPRTSISTTWACRASFETKIARVCD